MENEEKTMENDRLDVLSMLPESVRNAADSGARWIRSHPTEAFILGAVGGFAVGALGVGRALVAAKFLRSVPQVLPGIVAGMAVLAERFDTDSDERVTH